MVAFFVQKKAEKPLKSLLFRDLTRVKFVANTPDRGEVDRVFGVLFKVFAKRYDVVVDRPGVGEGVVAPDNFEDFFTADDLSCFGNQEAEELAFALGDSLRLACVGDNFERIKIDRSAVVKRERLEHLRGLVILRAKQPLHSQDQLLKVKGLSQVIIATSLQALHTVFAVVFGSQKQNGQPRTFRTEGFAHSDAIQLRHHDVQHCCVQTVLPSQCQRFFTVLCFHHKLAFPHKIELDCFAHSRVVFREEDAHLLLFGAIHGVNFGRN